MPLNTPSETNQLYFWGIRCFACSSLHLHPWPYFDLCCLHGNQTDGKQIFVNLIHEAEIKLSCMFAVVKSLLCSCRKSPHLDEWSLRGGGSFCRPPWALPPNKDGRPLQQHIHARSSAPMTDSEERNRRVCTEKGRDLGLAGGPTSVWETDGRAESKRRREKRRRTRRKLSRGFFHCIRWSSNTKN